MITDPKNTKTQSSVKTVANAIQQINESNNIDCIYENMYIVINVCAHILLCVSQRVRARAALLLFIVIITITITNFPKGKKEPQSDGGGLPHWYLDGVASSARSGRCHCGGGGGGGGGTTPSTAAARSSAAGPVGR